MRELKFRAWDKKRKEWVESFLAIDYEGLIVSLAHRDWEPLEEQGRYVIQQCTGLKDKNGKEIYEGDIVRLIYGPKFYLYTVPEDCGCDLRRQIDESGGEQEVIGNIWENPDMLKN